MSGRGGARPGAGRPVGAKSAKTLAIAERAYEEGITPLEVMLTAMRRHFDDGKLDEAAAVAKDAAPYMHPRLASIDQNVQGTVAVYVLPEEDESTDEWASRNAG